MGDGAAGSSGRRIALTAGSLAASVVSLALAQKLWLSLMLPHLVPYLQDQISTHGRLGALLRAFVRGFTPTFWGVGFLMSLPAFYDVKRFKIQKDRSMMARQLYQSMPLLVLNFLIALVLPAVSFFVFLPDRAFDFESVPSMRTILFDTAVWIALQEAMFFYIHRWFHTNKLMYQMVHKIHHTWSAPIAYVAIYAHPIEHLLANILPILAGPLLCGSHVACIVVFHFLGFLHTMAVHSGYWICDDHGMHDEHHAKFNCNYGVSGVLDCLYGSYRLPGDPTSSPQAQGDDPSRKRQ